jgi:hypothetical protein
MLNGSITVSQMAKIETARGMTGSPATSHLSFTRGGPDMQVRPCRLL